MSAQSPIRALDNDCLERIFVELRPKQGLRSLSLTCRWLRDACSDVLFERCIAYSNALRHPAEAFPPPHLWRHIRVLRMRGCFIWDPEYSDVESISDSTYQAVSDTVGREDILTDVLYAMPRLSTVVVHGVGERGVPWPILKVFLSAPQLSTFVVFGRLFSGETIASKASFSPGAITTFRYVHRNKRVRFTSSPAEKHVVRTVLERLSPTLHVLHLPSDSVPYRKLDRWDWSLLRELQLRGDGRRLLDYGVPLISILSRMPRLRSLSLKLARSGSEPLGAIWPPNSSVKKIPWPELESLIMTWLHPEEQLLRHLPSTLRDLHLRCWPRRYYPEPSFATYRSLRRLGKQRPDWVRKTPSASMVLQAIQSCRPISLQCLDLEYIADSNDIPLLRLVARSYPDLQYLQLCRYRMSEDLAQAPVVGTILYALRRGDIDTVIQESMSDALSPLRNLRALRLFLDFNHLLVDSDEWEGYDFDETDNLAVTAARHFARRASPTLQSIVVLEADERRVDMREFGVVRDPDGEPSVYWTDSYPPKRADASSDSDSLEI
ncbi:hypothetical protein NUW54_g264 [Trametes sanguinea]|uniref:Uncharacterized protein n=1 Tax=Trametes sanguinea TaxID=158606 RepID=A0ACC1QA86_9APHY|nr:hypothetical protein NUW54_g264 [Trametes sanguinea]